MLLTSDPSLASTVDDSAFLLTDERMWIAPFMDREGIKGGGGLVGGRIIRSIIICMVFQTNRRGIRCHY